MKVEKISIDKLIVNPNNTRMHGEKQIAEFKRSIEQFGVIRPIVCDDNYTILCGNGLYLALKEMGKQDVDCIVMKGLTENQKKKLLLTDNKIYNLGVDDFDAIDKIMQELKGDFDIPGYNQDDLNALYGNSSLSTDAAKSFEIPVVQPKPVQPPKQTVASTKVYSEPVHTEPSETGAQEQPAVQEKPYIICPHCNQKVYLDD